MFWRRSEDERSLDEAVRSCGKTATALSLSPDNNGQAASPVATRFGGAPYAEAGDAWPWVGDHPCDFICQLNLQDCVERPALPFDLITVFLCWEAWEDVDTDACIVRAYSHPAATRAIALPRPPSVAPEDYRTMPCRARSERLLTFPSPVDSFLRCPGIADAAGRFRDPYRAYRRSLKRIGYHERFATRLFGYPSWIQDNTMDDEGLLFLAQIGSEEEAGLVFGDAGVLFIAVHNTGKPEFVTDLWQCF